MRALVTGGGGFLGGRIVARLLQRGWQVRSLGRSRQAELEAQGVEVQRGNIAKYDVVRAAAEGCDVVFHVAAKAGVWGSRKAYWRTNVEGTRNVVAACREAGVRRLVHTSTPSVVFTGNAIAGGNEAMPYGHNFLCHYAETKALAEREALQAHDPQRLRVIALRPHLIWGVGDPHLLPRVIARARRGRLRVVGLGINRVDMTHVENAAHAHLLALEALEQGRGGGEAYFISDGQPVVLWVWINDLLKRLDLPPLSKSMSLKKAWRIAAVAEAIWRGLMLPGEPPMTRFVATELAKDHWFDISAARRDLHYAPVVPPQQGLDEFVRKEKLKAKG